MVSIQSIINRTEFLELFEKAQNLCEKITEDEFKNLFDETGYLKELKYLNLTNHPDINTALSTTNSPAAVIFRSAIYLRKLPTEHNIRSIVKTFIETESSENISLELPNCDIKSKTAIALANALQCTNIELLDLDNNAIGHEGMKAFSSLQTLKDLYIDSNSLNDDDLKILAHYPNLITLSLKNNNITFNGLVDILSSDTIKTLFLSNLSQDNERLLLAIAEQNFNITKFSEGSSEALKTISTRNQRLQDNLDCIQNIISDNKKTLALEKLQLAIDLINQSLKSLKFAVSPSAEKMKLKFQSHLGPCLKLKINYFQSINDMQSEINTLLELPVTYPEYENFRLNAFMRLYHVNPNITKPEAFAQALKTLIQDDNTLLTKFKDPQHQKDFDMILTSTLDKKWEIGNESFKSLDPSNRDTYLTQAISRWMPTDPDDIEFKSQLQSMILKPSGVVQASMFHKPVNIDKTDVENDIKPKTP